MKNSDNRCGEYARTLRRTSLSILAINFLTSIPSPNCAVGKTGGSRRADSGKNSGM